jgi:uncharacterized protein YraI
MNKVLGVAAGVLLTAIAVPSLAQAQNAYTTEFVNLRAGPGLDYPVVFEVPPSQPLDSYGCLSDWSWCDVSVGGYRGWMAGQFIAYAYENNYVPLYVYGPRYHVPIISFNFVSYWDRWYSDRPWYHDRDRWSHYDWRQHRWDDDRWRQWANTNRNQWDGRYRDGDRNWRNGTSGTNGGTWDRNRDRNNDGRNGDGRDGRNGTNWDHNRDRSSAVQPFTPRNFDGQRNTDRTDRSGDGNRWGGNTAYHGTYTPPRNGTAGITNVDPSQHSGGNDGVNGGPRRNTDRVNRGDGGTVVNGQPRFERRDTNQVNVNPGRVDGPPRFERRDTNQVNVNPGKVDRNVDRSNRVNQPQVNTNNNQGRPANVDRPSRTDTNRGNTVRNDGKTKDNNDRRRKNDDDRS